MLNFNPFNGLYARQDKIFYKNVLNLDLDLDLNLLHTNQSKIKIKIKIKNLSMLGLDSFWGDAEQRRDQSKASH